ncbi:hypothetical protein H5410_012036 [Solanum commersonii]|uniref:Uncharacterized protein n=1 Tax=Solanum commersonii TaxID=4109 RepID=A0A9J6ARI8_SOLCO|nr:hypothetical protein H5410_012036 [Solanum commersonii]
MPISIYVGSKKIRRYGERENTDDAYRERDKQASYFLKAKKWFAQKSL